MKKSIYKIIGILFILLIIGIVFYNNNNNNKTSTIEGKVISINGNEITIEAITPDNKTKKEYIIEINDNTKIQMLGIKVDLEKISIDSSVKITYIGKISNEKTARIKEVEAIEILTDLKISIIVYLDNNITSDDIKEIEKELTNIEGIKSVEYKSKEDKLNEMKESDPIFELIEDNSLSDEFIIKIEDYHKKEEIIKIINNLDHIKEVFYPK